MTHVGHGPRVEPGTRWNITPSASLSSEAFQDGAFDFVPTLWTGLGHGSERMTEWLVTFGVVTEIHGARD